MLHISTSEINNIILDFFSGSSTSAHAVIEFNREKDTTHKFVMVQLPELTDNPDYPTIAEIGKERIRRVIAQLKQEDKGKMDLSTREMPEDLGFKVFKLTGSNFKVWEDYQGTDIGQLQQSFDQYETPLADGWTPETLLTEVILLQGFPLDSAVTPLTGFTRNRIVAVESEFHTHRLVVCLDETLSDATIGHLDLAAEDVFVCLDSALTDQAKMQLQDRCNLNVI